LGWRQVENSDPQHRHPYLLHLYLCVWARALRWHCPQDQARYLRALERLSRALRSRARCLALHSLPGCQRLVRKSSQLNPLLAGLPQALQAR
jgi:hypothetical protein